MTVGVWEPSKPAGVSRQKLDQYLKVLQDINLDDLATDLPETMRQSDAGLMKMQPEQWRAAEQLEDEAIEKLIRFFTLAEMQLPNWDGGRTSPVIYLVKILKSRNRFDAELKQWIKANTDNRYLPNGAVIL